MMPLSRLADTVWRRHANPLSIWTRLLSTPLLYLPFWNRCWKQGLGVAAWFAVNPVLFPEPEDPDAWGPRAIRGERQWARERPHDASFAVQSAGAVAASAGLYSAYKRRLAPTAGSAVVVMAGNAWFLDRRAKTYGVERYDRTPRLHGRARPFHLLSAWH